MLSVEPFFAVPGSTISVAASTAVVTGTLNTTIGQAITVRAYNAGAATVFMEFGGPTVSAISTTAMPLASGAVGFFNVGQASTVATITSAGTATVYFTRGYGIS